MTTARQALRATVALSGMAAIGAGAAAPAFAAETTTPNVDIAQLVEFNKLNTAGVDGFTADSIVPAGTLAADVGKALEAHRASRTAASPTDPISSIGQMPGFAFELPPTTFGTAGEQQFDQAGLAPMMTPVMQHALPALTGGQRVSTAGASDQGSVVGQDNGLPGPVNGPANEAAGPVLGGLMPAASDAVGTLSDSTTNDDTTSNHEVQV
ncbi:MAG: hypothetical protein AB7J32_26470 [Pseudonocardia sp.]